MAAGEAPAAGGADADETNAGAAPASPAATLAAMSKLLVIAEKPSVGRDLARVLPGPFAKHEGWLEADDVRLGVVEE